MTDTLFINKIELARYVHSLLDNQTTVKLQKTLYLLFAHYGSTYGQIDNIDDQGEFNGQTYPPYLFNAYFQAGPYGPVETDIFNYNKAHPLSDQPISDLEIDQLFDTIEKLNVRDFIQNIVNQTNTIDDFSLVDHVMQDQTWFQTFHSNDSNQMVNDDIIQEYINRRTN